MTKTPNPQTVAKARLSRLIAEAKKPVYTTTTKNGK